MEGPTSEVAQADEAEGDILPFQFRPSTDTWLEGRLPQPQPVPLEASVSSSEVEGHDYKLMPSVGTWLHLPQQEQVCSFPVGQPEGGPEATSRPEVSFAEASVVSGEVDEQDYKLMPSALRPASDREWNSLFCMLVPQSFGFVIVELLDLAAECCQRALRFYRSGMLVFC
jgi:hypothetical protein